MGNETEQPGQRTPGPLNGPPAAGPDPAADPTSEADDEATPSEPVIPSHDRPRRRALRPPEALERLDRQWESQEPTGSGSSLASLELTVPEDPRGFDYLGALTGGRTGHGRDDPGAVGRGAARRRHADLRPARPTDRRARAARSTLARRRYHAALLAEIEAERDEADEDPLRPVTAPADRTTSTDPIEEVR